MAAGALRVGVSYTASAVTPACGRISVFDPARGFPEHLDKVAILLGDQESDETEGRSWHVSVSRGEETQTRS